MKSECEGMNAVLYARVSTDDKGQDTATQVRAMRRWCDERGVGVLGVYEEEKSGRDDVGRGRFSEMLGNVMLRNSKAPVLLEDGSRDPSTVHVDIILAWKANRLGRDQSDLDDLLQMAKALGVVIRFVSEDVRPEDPTGRLLYTFNSWQGERENENNSVNTKAGINNARLKGVVCGRRYAMVFREDVGGTVHDPSDPRKSKIQLEAHPGRGLKRPKANVATVIPGLDDVMGLAGKGYSRAHAARILGVSRTTLTRRLADHG